MPRVALNPPAARSLVTPGVLRQAPSPRKFYEIEHCRICGNRDLAPILSMGEQHLTGVFPTLRNAPLSKGPLELVACNTVRNPTACGLVQLRQTYDLNEMYGENYGYRSSLNRSMVRHLEQKVHQLMERYPLKPGDLVLDIGSNDGLCFHFTSGARRHRCWHRSDVKKFARFPMQGYFADSRFLFRAPLSGAVRRQTGAHRHVDRDVLRFGRSFDLHEGYRVHSR